MRTRDRAGALHRQRHETDEESETCALEGFERLFETQSAHLYDFPGATGADHRLHRRFLPVHGTGGRPRPGGERGVLVSRLGAGGRHGRVRRLLRDVSNPVQQSRTHFTLRLPGYHQGDPGEIDRNGQGDGV